MARINLLPWREKEREKKNQEFLIQLIVVFLLACLLAFLAWTFFNLRLENQNQANGLITEANTELSTRLEQIKDLEEERNGIISRMNVIQDLQGKRPLPVHVLDELVRTMPQNLFYHKVERTGDVLKLSGRADNPNTVSDLLRNIGKTNWLDNAKVQKISSNEKSKPKTIENAKDSSIVITSTVAPESSYISFEMTAEINMKKEKSSTEKSSTENANTGTE